MLALASILSAFATIVCLYRSQAATSPKPAVGRNVLGLAAIGGLAVSLALAVVARGWPAGIGQWLAALMVTGVAVVSLAGNHPALTQRLGFCSAAAGVLIAMTHWASQ